MTTNDKTHKHQNESKGQLLPSLQLHYNCELCYQNTSIYNDSSNNYNDL